MSGTVKRISSSLWETELGTFNLVTYPRQPGRRRALATDPGQAGARKSRSVVRVT